MTGCITVLPKNPLVHGSMELRETITPNLHIESVHEREKAKEHLALQVLANNKSQHLSSFTMLARMSGVVEQPLKVFHFFPDR